MVRTIHFKGVHPKQKILLSFIYTQAVCFEELWGVNNIWPHWHWKNTEPFVKISYFAFHRRKKVIQFGKKHEGELMILGKWHGVIEANAKTHHIHASEKFLLLLSTQFHFSSDFYIFPVIKKCSTHTANFKDEVFLKSFLRNLMEQQK